jgi:hypothetical protein
VHRVSRNRTHCKLGIALESRSGQACCQFTPYQCRRGQVATCHICCTSNNARPKELHLSDTCGHCLVFAPTARKDAQAEQHTLPSVGVHAWHRSPAHSKHETKFLKGHHHCMRRCGSRLSAAGAGQRVPSSSTSKPVGLATHAGGPTRIARLALGVAPHVMATEGEPHLAAGHPWHGCPLRPLEPTPTLLPNLHPTLPDSACVRARTTPQHAPRHLMGPIHC